jgi:hypothetical protein
MIDGSNLKQELRNYSKDVLRNPFRSTSVLYSAYFSLSLLGWFEEPMIICLPKGLITNKQVCVILYICASLIMIAHRLTLTQ